MPTKLNTAFNTDLITLAAEVILGKSYGSGIYIYKDKQIFFCTARHVLFNNTNPQGKPNFQLKQNHIQIKSYPKNTDYKSFEKINIDLGVLAAQGLLSVNQLLDTCVLKIADISNNQLQLSKGIKKITHSLNINVASSAMVKPAMDIQVGEELYVIGYPKAVQLLNRKQPFYDYNLPLVRKGITSCMNDYKTFIIDCSVVGGNSGGPVFIAENIITNTNGKIEIKNNRYLVGIAIQYIPLLNMTAKQMNPKMQTFNHAENSGYGVCVSFNEITKEIDNLVSNTII